MRLGIALPTEDAVEPPAADGRRILSAETIAEGARRIEAAGFDSAWVFDSIGRGFLLPDPLIALSVAATVTSGSSWALASCRSSPESRGPRPPDPDGPPRVGRAAEARRGCGLDGADFDALGMDFPSRFRRFGEDLATMRCCGRGSAWARRSSARGPRPRAGRRSSSARGRVPAGSSARRASSTAGSDPAPAAAGRRSPTASRASTLGGKRAILTNVVVRLDSPTASPEGPDDPFDLACPPEIARERLARIIAGLRRPGAVSRRHDEAHLRQLRALL